VVSRPLGNRKRERIRLVSGTTSVCTPRLSRHRIVESLDKLDVHTVRLEFLDDAIDVVLVVGKHFGNVI
jgi:hypothetical protein